MGSKNSQKISSMWTYYYIAEHSVRRGQYKPFCRISGFQILLYGIMYHTYTVYTAQQSTAREMTNMMSDVATPTLSVPCYQHWYHVPILNSLRCIHIFHASELTFPDSYLLLIRDQRTASPSFTGNTTGP
jgi:hypothetical protein